MTANSVQNLKSRLRVVPIDVWSTREKLCLAASVLRSGDQNWSSVSRPLRVFGEPNRPTDWFHQKYCAIQYQDLLEKIETETPKRKRSERGEETPQTIIVRNLTKQRIQELREITETESQLILRLKQDLDLIKGNKMSEKRLQEISKEINDKEIKEAEEEVKHKKWLEERDVKIAQMSRKGGLQARPKVTTPSTVATPVSQTTVSNTSVAEIAAKSPINEPLKVEIDLDTNSPPKPTQLPNLEIKTTLALTSPSSSPLLTSLLQSPTASSTTLLSPNKAVITTDPFSRQKPSTPMTPITRRPPIHPIPEAVTEVKTPEKTESVVKEIETKAVVSADTTNQSLNKSILEAETTSPSKSKATTAENISTETEAQEKRDSNESAVTSDQTKTSDVTEVQKEVMVLQNKTNVSIITSDVSEKVSKSEETNDRLLRNKSKTDESISGRELSERKDDNKETDESIDKRVDESMETIAIKEEMFELNAEDMDVMKETDNSSIKEEATDQTSNTSADDSNQRTPSTRLNKSRLRKTPPTITPTAMRRSSRRAAQKDLKSNDDSTEVSDQSAANTPQAVKKRGSVDENTETSMSEESMDSKIVINTTSADTVPNSPASVRTEDMDNSKEYLKWKRSIMVNWRLISAHKNASLFAHPVTEADAKGYDDIVRKPIDLNSIKKRLETGVIRTTDEYQRDLLLMFQNAIMFNSADHDVHKMAVDMQKDTIANIEAFIEAQKQDNQSNESKLRARERRSNVSTTASPVITESEISGRRKSRGASTDTDSNASGLTKSAVKKKKP